MDETQNQLQLKSPVIKKPCLVQLKPNDFHPLFNRKLVTGSAIARVRRQQLKVIKTFQEHHYSMQSFDDYVDNCIQIMFDEYLK